MPLFSSIISGIGALGSAIGSSRAARAQARALREAQSFAREGRLQAGGFTGPGGMFGRFDPTTGQIDYGLGDLQGFSEQLQGLGGQFAEGARTAGVTPEMQNLFEALGGIAGQAPGAGGGFFSGLQGQLGGALGLAGQGLAGASPVAPGLSQAAFGAAAGLIPEAGMGGAEAASDRLRMLREQAAPFEEGAFSNLQNQLFSTGRLGTSGGALQTEAFARGLGQADLSRQLAAAEEGRRFTQDALRRSQGLFGLGAEERTLSDDLLGQAFSRFGNIARLGADVEGTRFGQALRAQQNLFTQGQELLGAAGGLARMPAALQQLYLQNAMSASRGMQDLSRMPLAGLEAAMNLERARSGAALSGASILMGGVPQAGQREDVLSGIFGGLGQAARGGQLDFLGNLFGGGNQGVASMLGGGFSDKSPFKLPTTEMNIDPYGLSGGGLIKNA